MKVTLKSLKITFLILLFVNSQNYIFSQISVNSYLESGTNNVSEGVYGSFSGQLLAKFGTFTASTGALLLFTNANPDPNILSAYKIGVENEFKISNNPINLDAFYLYKPFSKDLQETNLAVLVDYRVRHLGCQLGMNTRIFSFNNEAKKKYNFLELANSTIWEPFNLMYKFTYCFQITEKSNIEASVTDFDTYIIERETNPMLRVKFNYKLNEKLLLYSDLGYMEAGLLNMRVNYFGVFLRGGVIWQIK